MKVSVLLKEGKIREAIVCYDKAIELNPKSSDAYKYKGISMKKLGYEDKANECYDKALDINPNDAEANVKKAKIMILNEKLEEAVKYL